MAQDVRFARADRAGDGVCRGRISESNRSDSPRRPLQFAAPVAALLAASAWAGGTGEHALIIVDPTNADSLYVANYYREARDIPNANFLYYVPGAANLTEFHNTNRLATLGAISNAQIGTHADYVIVMPGAPFFVAAPGEISDTCFPVNRFSISGAYTLLYELPEIVGPGTRASTTLNTFYTTGNTATSFSAQTRWLNGFASTSPAAEQYLIGALLGYTGPLGNSVSDILTMIDRSTAADGSRPAGTFYFMRTTDTARSGPRDPFFGNAISAIVGNGGAGLVLNAVLPTGRVDCLGVMTGWADPAIDSTSFTITPGAFCDHLTSWAAMFDNGGQVKASRWIAKGAAGSFGAVEEPCNYAGKFPAPRVHVFYQRGLTLGEACFRSLAYQPYQGLLLGDPLTRPFTILPTVSVANWPSAAVSGVWNVTPTALANGGPAIGAVRLLIDGVQVASQAPGTQFSIDTTDLADGWHDVRFLADAAGAITTSGRYANTLLVNNRGRSASLTVSPASGTLATTFSCSVSGGAAAREVRVTHNGRVVASRVGTSGNFTIPGHYLGAGPVDLIGESIFPDGAIVRSVLRRINITSSGAPSNSPAAPIAFDFSQDVNTNSTFPIALPARFEGPLVNTNFEIVSPPAVGTLNFDRPGPFVLYTPDATLACGSVTFTYRVTNGANVSNTATVRLNYGLCAGDTNCDGVVTVGDISGFVSAIVDPAAYLAGFPGCALSSADINGDGFVTTGDIGAFVLLLTGP